MMASGRYDKPKITKRQRKPQGQLRMDNPETLATLCAQDTGRI